MGVADRLRRSYGVSKALWFGVGEDTNRIMAAGVRLRELMLVWCRRPGGILPEPGNAASFKGWSSRYHRKAAVDGEAPPLFLRPSISGNAYFELPEPPPLAETGAPVVSPFAAVEDGF